jgi:hypothetical protein
MPDVYSVNITVAKPVQKAKRSITEKYLRRPHREILPYNDGAECNTRRNSATVIAAESLMYEAGTITVKNGGKLECQADTVPYMP